MFLAVAVALVGGGYFYLHFDDQISRYVQRLFADHYRHLQVEVGTARFEQGRGVFVSDLSLAEPRSAGPPQSILAVDELFLASDSRFEEVVCGKLQLSQIVIRRPRLRAVRLADGRWNVATLLPLPKFSDETPEMVIEDATLILEDAARHTVAPLSLRGINIQLTPGESAAADGNAHAGQFRVTGTVTGVPSRALTFTGTITPQTGALELVVEIHGLEVSPELIAAIPGPLPGQLQGVELDGSADATLHLSRPAGGDGQLAWSADVAFSRGRLGHQLLPQPLTELTATLRADRDKLVLSQLTGKLGAADVTLACERHGWSAAAPLGLAGRIQGLAVNPELQAALPGGLERLWHRFRPVGIVDAEIRLTFDGREWRPELTAHCRGLSLTDAEKFPYPVEQATGTVALTRSTKTGAMRLDLDLVGSGDGKPIRIAAQLDHLAVPTIPVGGNGGAATVAFGAGIAERTVVRLASATQTVPALPKPTGWIEVSGAGVSIHELLLAALPDKAEAFVRSLRAQGLFDFRWRFERTDPLAPRGDTALDLKLADCAMQYERFAYPLQQIRGQVTARNGHYTLANLVGRDRQGSAVVTCHGEAESSDAGLALALVFQGSSVPLDENLKQSLSPQVQQVWTDLRPQGRVDFTADVHRQPGQPKPTVDVALQPHQQSVSVEPTFFPYRFEQVDGRAIVSAGRVELQQMRGTHGRSTFTADGTWQATTGGGWQLVLTGLHADRLAFDPDLLRAMPLGVQKVVDRVRPVGNFDVFNSSLQFVRRSDASQVAAGWDMQLACHQSALRGDLPLENLTGGIRLMGQSDGPNATSYGELAIDSLIWNDVQLTNVHGPFWSDSNICFLGRGASAKLAQQPRRISADVFGGTIVADVQLHHAGQPRYVAEISVGGVDLGRVARERLGGPGDLTGTVSGKLSLTGAGRSVYALSGKGDLHVVDANIYRLPVLVALLKVLRNRSPDTTAFDRCDMQFDVRGEHIHFQQLNLLGDAVSLYGRGETNFDRRLNLVFYTLVGPADLPIPLWKTVAGQLSQQGLQLKVDGTWDSPQIHREAFPMVNQIIEQIRSEAEQGAAAVAPPAAAGIPWVTPPR